MKSIDHIFREFDRDNSPGCAVGVIKNGEVIYSKGYGIANLEYKIPITPQSVFCLASNSKQFAGASVALLELECKIRASDDIRTFIPELPSRLPQTTIAHLLHQTSGIKDYYVDYCDNGYNDNHFITEDQAIDFILEHPERSFPPGEQHEYSNSNYVLLSLIVNRVAGQSLGQFASERLFMPLNMRHTFFREMHSKIIHNRAVGYCVEPVRNSVSKYFNIPGESTDPHHINMGSMEITGDDGVWSTLEDQLIWLKSFGDKPFGEAFWQKLSSPGRLNTGVAVNYGYGLEIAESSRGKWVGHSGWVCGYPCTQQYYPDEGLGVVILSNTTRLLPWEVVGEVLRAIGE